MTPGGVGASVLTPFFVLQVDLTFKSNKLNQRIQRNKRDLTPQPNPHVFTVFTRFQPMWKLAFPGDMSLRFKGF
ncbi:MAG: hypothetical protein GX130_03145 [Candidatus Hydrogenedens sp.]|jgi:hypothetical protein|nr:hypothetical protein [Candidatus Hydrogenedens sp.]